MLPGSCFGDRNFCKSRNYFGKLAALWAGRWSLVLAAGLLCGAGSFTQRISFVAATAAGGAALAIWHPARSGDERTKIAGRR